MKIGIIFDMDGTLWDSAAQVTEAWNIALRKLGYADQQITIEGMYAAMGKTMDVIARMFFPTVPQDELPVLLEACCKEENIYLREHGGQLYPQVRATMEQLKDMGYPLYIVSNCQAGYIEAFLDFYRLWDLIADIQCYGDNGLQKADNIRILCERNGLRQAVYVGDIQGDYDAATEAGVGFVHAAYGFGTVDADVPVIHAFAELPEIIKGEP